MSTLFFAIVILGFARSYYLRTPFDFPELAAHLYLHGAVLTAWITLALIQPWLIETRRIELHRRFGVLGVALAFGVVMTGLWTVGLRDVAQIDESPASGAPNILSLAMFLACVVMAVLFRHKSATHKRLMLFASIPILGPALDRVARIPVINELWAQVLSWIPAPTEVAFALLSFLLLQLVVVVNDLVTQKRVHPGTLWGLCGIWIIAPATTYVFVTSGAWVGFVHLIV